MKSGHLVTIRCFAPEVRYGRLLPAVIARPAAAPPAKRALVHSPTEHKHRALVVKPTVTSPRHFLKSGQHKAVLPPAFMGAPLIKG